MGCPGARSATPASSKSRRPHVRGSQIQRAVQSKHLIDGLQYRRVVILRMVDSPRRNIRRGNESRDKHTGAVERKVVRLELRILAGARRHAWRRAHVVEEASVLVKRDNEHAAGPANASQRRLLYAAPRSAAVTRIRVARNARPFLSAVSSIRFTPRSNAETSVASSDSRRNSKCRSSASRVTAHAIS